MRIGNRKIRLEIERVGKMPCLERLQTRIVFPDPLRDIRTIFPPISDSVSHFMDTVRNLFADKGKYCEVDSFSRYSSTGDWIQNTSRGGYIFDNVQSERYGVNIDFFSPNSDEKPEIILQFKYVPQWALLNGRKSFWDGLYLSQGQDDKNPLINRMERIYLLRR